MENKHYCNMQRYDFKGRRVAVFGELTGDPDTLRVVVFTCSKHDHFCKATARDAWQQFKKSNFSKYHPEIFEISVDDELGPKKTFLKWCDQNYRRISSQFALVKGKPIRQLVKTIGNNTMQGFSHTAVLIKTYI